MKTKLIGRQDELDFLQQKLLSPRAELGIMYGRRRVGKSSLLKEVSSKKKYFFEAINKLPLKRQIEHFLKQFSEQEGLPLFKGSTWEEAFDVITPFLKEGRVFVVFDEIPWMANDNPTFIALIKYYWDNKWKLNKDITLILCGSIAQFMVNHVLHSEALHNRKTFEMKVQPLPCYEAARFFKLKTSEYEKALFLMTLGGIPKYLEQMDVKKSFTHNLREEFFRENGFFIKEFDTIFKEQFKVTKVYEKIVRELTSSSKSLSELGAALNMEGGGFNEYLQNLIHADFITRYMAFDLHGKKKEKTIKYELSDEFLRFYLNIMEPHINLIEAKMGENLLSSLQRKLEAYYGKSFELFCIKNIKTLLKIMKINESDVINFGPYFHQGSRSNLISKKKMKIIKSKAKEGVQIDLMIVLKKKRIIVCECKFTDAPIGVDVIDEVEDKIKKLVTKSGFSISPVLISAQGATKELYQKDYFDQIVDLTSFF